MRLLFLCHAHPELQTGGTEIFARDLFRTLRDGGDEGVFLAATSAAQRAPAPGTPFQAVGAADELLIWSGGFDTFHLSQVDLHGVAPAFEGLLRELRPELVHIHHLLGLGAELPGLIRRVLPQARIVMTLHDFYPICAHDGQMVTTAGALCRRASADACRRCLPERTVTDFRLRALHVGGALAQIDRFVAPSRFLRDRFVAWGIDPGRIEVVANGIPAAPVAPIRAAARRDRFCFVGHINRFKGATTALAASALLSGGGVAHSLTLRGGTAHQAPETIAAFQAALAGAPAARHAGAYERGELATLLADADWVVTPSVWWENAPLVIQEAFLHRRPVICSGIGGMAEMVRDGIDGLHAAPGDPASLAQAMARAADEPGLWQRLHEGMAAPVSLADSAAAHRALYARVLRPRPARARGTSGLRRAA